MELKDKKTKVIFHAGILTIGGTVIEIAYEDSHIFFDFGTEFKPELKLADESLTTLIENRLVPVLDHIYNPALLPGKADTKNPFNHTAVFLSHCHLDHTRMINFLEPKIPLYALKETKILVESLNAKNNFLLPLQNYHESFTRDIIGVENETIVQVGDISVELKRVDHDAYGACGMIIKTPDMHITYTGDLRLHGFDNADTLKFANDAKGTDMLIIEGVSLSFDDRPGNHVRIESEQGLLDQVIQTVKDYEGKQVTFSLYPGNVRRIAEFVKQVPRKVVLEASFAYVLKQCLGMDANYYTNDDQTFNLNPEFEIDRDVLYNDEGEYFWQVTQDFEKLKGGGIYIHSDATPLGEFDPTYLPFIQTLENAGVEFKRLACSGHAFAEDLDAIVALIQPKCLIPIHSLKPEKLENPYGSRHLVKRGEVL